MRRLVLVFASAFLLGAATPAAGDDYRPLAYGRSPEAPFWSSDGRLVAVPRLEVSGSRLSLFDRVSGAERVVPLPQSYSVISRVSADRILFDNISSLDVVSWAGQPIAHIEPAPRESRTWAPDGEAFAYTSYRIPLEPAIAVFEVRTGAVRSFGPGYLVAWSPDGRELAVARRTEGGTDVVAIRVDGSGERLLGSLPATGFSSAYELEWSPDARSVAALQGADRAVHVLTEGADTRIPEPHFASEVVWSPTSGRMALLSFERTVLVDRDGGNRVEFERASDLAWSPDGGEVLYLADRLVRARPSAGGDARGVTTAVAFGRSPDARFLGLIRSHEQLLRTGDCLEDRPVLFDRVTGAERVLGRCWIAGAAGNDDLVGSDEGDEMDGFDGRDRLQGRGGEDVVRGWQGPDRLSGGSGVDRLQGGRGADSLFSRDGERDVVDCGPGRDRAVADRADTVGSNCERVSRR